MDARARMRIHINTQTHKRTWYEQTRTQTHTSTQVTTFPIKPEISHALDIITQREKIVNKAHGEKWVFGTVNRKRVIQ